MLRLGIRLLLISLVCGILSERSFASATPSVPQVDRAVAAFMEKHRIPGLSLAITRDERLVYARGYGFADLEQQRPATPENRFRIASLSKPITAVAILKLVEEEKLSLDDLVFGPSGLLATASAPTDPDSPVNRITVHHLLQHTAGGWSNAQNDPMFSRPSLGADALLEHVLKTRPLEQPPGTAYAYSNFGYFLLGQIIENVTGEPYETYVQRHILAPAGIDSMVIAGNTPAERVENEVTYYPETRHSPYAFNVRRMDAHGGWIASAPDLVRFLVHVDGFASCPDILRPETVEIMTTPSEANPRYASGWAVNQADNWWHVGSLPGTGALMVRTEAGFNWAVLTNKRGTADSSFVQDLDQLLWPAINDPRTKWPAHANPQNSGVMPESGSEPPTQDSDLL